MAKFAGKDAAKFVKARSSKFVKREGNLDVYTHSFTDAAGPFATVTLDRKEVRFHSTEAEVEQELSLYS